MPPLCSGGAIDIENLWHAANLSAMSCLYRSDYGAPDPHFNPLAGNGRLLQGYAGHRTELTAAQNIGQLEAMKRKFDHGETVQWCDQGYGWVYDWKVDYFFGVVLVVFVIPYVLMRFFPSLRRLLLPRQFSTHD